MTDQSTLSHRQRIETCLAGGKPDHFPIALWRHFPVADQTPEGLAASTIAFQKEYQFDIVKVTPASSFCIKDWGCEDTWCGNPEGTRDYTRRAINQPEDWSSLQKLSPRQGQLAGQIRCLQYLQKEFGDTTPYIQTIFSPLSQAKNLVGPQELLIHLRQYPDLLHAALQVITDTTIDFISEAMKTGISGIFYAIQHAQYGLLSEAEYQQFGVAYDIQILKSIKGLWFNMLHIHGENIMFNLVASYPVQVINWHDRHTAPSLKEAWLAHSGVLCGGLRRQETMLLGTPEQVTQEVLQSYVDTNGIRHILGTGCVLDTHCPPVNIHAACQAARKL